MKKEYKESIDRKEFIKRIGVGSLFTAAALTGCRVNKTGEVTLAEDEVPTDKMEYRTNPKTGDKVSILGYGCMRWPTMEQDGKTVIDQERVNSLVDYAIGHGVNFFDTAPVYVQGLSEKATGNALKRHPRESFFISTKMSNFSNASRENSIIMYENSFKNILIITYYIILAAALVTSTVVLSTTECWISLLKSARRVESRISVGRSTARLMCLTIYWHTTTKYIGTLY